jgi:hypothetical protein
MWHEVPCGYLSRGTLSTRKQLACLIHFVVSFNILRIFGNDSLHYPVLGGQILTAKITLDLHSCFHAILYCKNTLKPVIYLDCEKKYC